MTVPRQSYVFRCFISSGVLLLSTFVAACEGPPPGGSSSSTTGDPVDTSGDPVTGTATPDDTACTNTNTTGTDTSGTDETTTGPSGCVFQDPMLEAAVRVETGVGEGALTEDVLVGVTSLSAPGQGIESLEGLECLEQLESLVLSDNAIVDISPLGGLTALVNLELDGNAVNNIAPLAGLPGLMNVDLEGNSINELDPLVGAMALQHVNIRSNQVESVAPLLMLPDLATGDVRDNGLACDDPDLVELVITIAGMEHDDCTAASMVFLSEATVVGGTLGGIEAADALCQAEAEAAGRVGTFIAWISDPVASPSVRFDQTRGPYYLVNGQLVADDWADLTDGTLPANGRIAVTVTGQGIGGAQMGDCRVWTGTLADGTRDDVFGDCGDWSDPSVSGTVGFWDGLGGGGWCDSDIPSQWSGGNAANVCDLARRLYCFEQ